MNIDQICLMIGKIREKEKIESEEISCGICTVQLLNKIEKGKAQPDFLLMEILVQRLGRSLNRQEILLALDEYEQIELRDVIQEDLCHGRIADAERKLSRLGWGDEGKEVVYRMYDHKLRGILDYEKEDYASAETHLRQAAELTMGKKEVARFLEGREGRTLQGRFSQVEIETLILLVQIRLTAKQIETVGKMLCNLYAYVEKQVKDGEANARIVSKIAVLLAGIDYRRGKYGSCISLCKDTLERLRKYGMISCMTPLLGILADAYGETGGQDRAKILCWKNVIERLYAHFNISLEAVNKLYFNSCICQYYLVGEMVREERLARGLSQELLIVKVGYKNPESLSRVENGVMPHSKTLKRLFEELGIREERYMGRIITDNYVLLLIFDQISALQMQKKYKETEALLGILKESVDLTIVENRQLIDGLMVDEKYTKGMINENEAIRETIKLLKLTYKPKSKRVPCANETLLINQLCNLLVFQKKYEEAITWQKQTVELYQRSRVKMKYHFCSVYLVVDNMLRNMTYMRYEEAEEWANISMQAQLRNGKGNATHLVLNSLIGMTLKKDLELCKTYVRWAYCLADIFNIYRDRQLMKQYFKEKFKEEINWD